MNFKPLTLAILCLFVADVKAQVTISSGTNVIIAAGANIIINDLSLQYGNSSLLTNGNLVFSGNTDNFISGTTSLINVTLSKTAGKKLSLSNSLALTGMLTLNTGILDLNGYNLNLGNTGSLQNESANAYVGGSSGYIIANANLNSPQGINPGNVGVTLTSNANWGNTIVRRGNYALSYNNHQTIKRFFEVVPTNNNNLNATIRFHYLDGELNNIPENQLKLLFSNDNGITWVNLNSTINAQQNYIEAANVNSMGRFSSSTEDFTTLPIAAIQLSSLVSQSGIKISWTTINEVDVNHFIVEKSTNGVNFSTVANVASKSATSNNNDYSAADKTPIAGTSYYRVRGIDKDGKETISSILPVNFALSKQELNIFPNPSTKLIKVQYYSSNQQPITLAVISNLGKTVLSKVIQPQVGLNELPLDVTTLPAGIYYLRVFNTTFNNSTKFIKN